MLKPEPESLMMDHQYSNAMTGSGAGGVIMRTKDYIWIRKGTVGLIAIIILIVFIVFGFIVHFLSICDSEELSSNSIKSSTTLGSTPASIYIRDSSDSETQSVTTVSSLPTTIPTTLRSETKATQTILDQDDAEVVFKRINYSDYRLSEHIKPIQYNLNLVPLFSKAENNIPVTFRGHVNITIVVDSAEDVIRLHATAMSLDGIPKLISKADNKSVKIHGYEINETNQFLTIRTNSTIVPGEYYLVVQFTGVFNDLMRGFYRSSYVQDNKTVWLVATQFEPTDARRAFPCFDEPDFKARFRIALGRPKNLKSLSNNNLDTTTEESILLPALPSDDYVWDIYNNTELMSTYLVAFAILDFRSLSHHANFSVWAREGVIKQAEYALDFGEKVLKYFEEFFQIKYPLPKMDMLALPDFGAGAMENWGLTTYRETAMLYQKGMSPTESLKRVSTVVSHELAHQWFGNLVTPKWWSDLWLNEGFASYVEYIGVDFVHPEWQVNSQFVTDEVHYVMALDSLLSSHRISVEVQHHDEINEIFDRISYSKGASVIRMMDHFLSRKTFQKGLTAYLNEKKYQNAEQDDLWKALTVQSHLDNTLSRDITVKDIMDTWTLQVGYPVITLIRDYEEASGILTQNRFLINPNNDTSSTKNFLWFVPINIATKLSEFDNTKPQKWMKNSSLKLNNLPGKDHWVIANIQQTGFYRVNYDEINWKLIYHQLIINHTEIHELNRAQIIDDTVNLARAGLLNYNMALSLTSYLKKERHLIPWKAGFNVLGFLNTMLVRTGEYHYFKKYVLNLIEDAYKDIGFDQKASDTQLDLLLRIDLINWACLLDEHKCMQQSVRMFQNWMGSPDPDLINDIPADIRSIIYCTAIRQGTELEWTFAWKRYLNSNLGFEQEILLSALGCSREPWILTRYMQLAITENSGVRRQDVTRVFSSVTQNPIGRDLSFNFIRNNWKDIRKYFDSSASVLISIVKVCIQDKNTDYEKSEILQWVKDHNKELGVGLRTIHQAIETIQTNIYWMETYRAKIMVWIRSYLDKPDFNGFEPMKNDVLENEKIVSLNEKYQI